MSRCTFTDVVLMMKSNGNVPLLSVRFSSSGSVRVQHHSPNQNWLRGTVLVSISLCQPTAPQQETRPLYYRHTPGRTRPPDLAFIIQPFTEREESQGGGGALLQCNGVWSGSPAEAASKLPTHRPRSKDRVGGVRTPSLRANKRRQLLLYRNSVKHGGHICGHQQLWWTGTLHLHWNNLICYQSWQTQTSRL